MPGRSFDCNSSDAESTHSKDNKPKVSAFHKGLYGVMVDKKKIKKEIDAVNGAINATNEFLDKTEREGSPGPLKISKILGSEMLNRAVYPDES
ncbi:MAG TPA: hypothetical protein VGL94_21520 [Ktedonobacteraceae bacterium]|jgi:hypothetical protein